MRGVALLCRIVKTSVVVGEREEEEKTPIPSAGPFLPWEVGRTRESYKEEEVGGQITANILIHGKQTQALRLSFYVASFHWIDRTGMGARRVASMCSGCQVSITK
jgi:hypothetical protein